MKNVVNKSVIILFFVAFISMMIIPSNRVKASSSSLYLNNVDYNINVNTDGSIDVKEVWNIDIDYTNTLYKDFKIDKTKYSSIDNCTVSKIENGKEVELADCNEYYYHVPTDEYYFLERDGNYEVAWGTGMEDYSGTKQYIIRYHVNDAIAKYNDCAELYWQAFGSDFEIEINKINGTITLPNEANSKDDIKVWGHTPDLNGTINVTDLDKINFEVNDNQSNKMVEVRVAMPSKMITYSERAYSIDKLSSIISEETSWANSANASRIGKIAIISVALGIIIIILILLIIKNIKIIRTTKKIKPTQHYDYFRELPDKASSPAEARMIIDDLYDGISSDTIGPIFMATILQLNLKKIINIEKTMETGNEDYRIYILNNNQQELSESEKLILEYLEKASNNNSITMKELKKYIELHNESILSLKSKLDKILSNSIENKNILNKDGIKKKSSLMNNGIAVVLIFVLIFLFGKYPSLFSSVKNTISISTLMIIPIIILIILSIITGVIAGKNISIYNQYGVDIQDKWRAFKKYMEDFSLLNEREIPEIALWENYLVYATAFGIADKVIKQLKIVYPQYYSDGNVTSDYVTMSMLSNSSFYNSFNSISSATSSSFSSGSGGGGGFSGGGGGGGGRWRRRRTLKLRFRINFQKYLHYQLKHGIIVNVID